MGKRELQESGFSFKSSFFSLSLACFSTLLSSLFFLHSIPPRTANHLRNNVPAGPGLPCSSAGSRAARRRRKRLCEGTSSALFDFDDFDDIG